MPITYDDNAVQVGGAPAHDDPGNSEPDLADGLRTDPEDITGPGERDAVDNPAGFTPDEMAGRGLDDAGLDAADLAELRLAFLTEADAVDADVPVGTDPEVANAEPAAGGSGPTAAGSVAERADSEAAAAGSEAATGGSGREPAPTGAKPRSDPPGNGSQEAARPDSAEEPAKTVGTAEAEPDGASTCVPEPAAAEAGAPEASAPEPEAAEAGTPEATPPEQADPEPAQLETVVLDLNLIAAQAAEPESGTAEPAEAATQSNPESGTAEAPGAAESAESAGRAESAGAADDGREPELVEAPAPAGYMRAGGVLARLDPTLAASGFGYERYTSLAGPLTSPPRDRPYRVQYRSIHSGRREWLATRIITLSLVALDIRFMYWLIFQSQYPHLQAWLWQSSLHAMAADSYVVLRAGMAAGSIVMQTFLLINVLTVSRACLAARDPVPVEPDPGLRVAFLTTIVPDREPIELAERTLRAASEIAYAGRLDLWLLDEGDSAQAREMCERLGVRHFSRKGRGYLELETGTFASKTKHGNHNRWLWEHAGDYDVVMFVDTDHVPLPIMAERLLGYFRDPEVAFVVAPQFYGNTENRITRWAESAQYLFHSVIQRAGNRRQCAMLVGTNAAVRTSAIRNGYVASITEDMATSIKIHTTKSDVTGRAWRSVYTPDLVAVGEGPATWTEFFGQQTRWSAGTYDALARQVWRMIFRLRPSAMLHYLLMLTYYPSVALGWLMGITISSCYLGFGISSLRTNEGWWLTYYVDVAVIQFLLYRFMRRHNVSPHEPAGSSGISGMVVSALTAPIYARALLKVILGRKLTFNVTAKGSSVATDRLGTFRYSLTWAFVPVLVLALALTRHRPYLMMIGWTVVILTVCLAPVVVWLWDRRVAARAERSKASSASRAPAGPQEANLTSAASF